MAAPNIGTASGRARLAPQREPYFVKIAKCQYLGFRRTEDGGSWIARQTITGGKKKYHCIGTEAQFPEYDDALRAALAWFEQASDDDPQANSQYTVADAIRDHVSDLTTRRTADAGRRAGLSAGKHIVPHIGKVPVAKLTTRKLRAWRNSLVPETADEEKIRRARDTANRVISILKAALNLAFRDGIVRQDTARRRLEPFPNVGRPRDVFLTRTQCEALLEACEPDFRELARSALLTGARLGELVRRTVADFDGRSGVLRVPDGKTGARNVVLSDTAIQHFRRLSKDKLPAALLHVRADGEQWNHAMQFRRIREAVKAANAEITKAADRIPAATCFYSLRHTHASLALLAGVQMQVLAENMGTSIRMIEKYYGKFLRGDRRAMFNAVAIV